MQRIALTSRWRRLKAVLPLRRLIHLTLMLAVIANIVSQLPINSQKAIAWSGDSPSCVKDPLTYEWTYKDKIHDLLGITVDSYNGSWILGSRSSGIIQMWFSHNMTIQTSAGVNQLVMNGGDGAVDITTESSHPNFQRILTTTSAFGSTVTLDDFTCIDRFQNPTYSNTYTGKRFDEGSPNQFNDACATFDIACRIAGTFQGVQNTFLGVGKAIVIGISSAFIPDAATVKNQFDTLYSFMIAKLGFLTYPITWASNTYTSFSDTSNNWCTDTNCVMNFDGQLFGGTVSIDFYALKHGIPTMWTYLLLVFRAITVIALISSFYKILMETIRS
jgi:hypothetical protein